MITIEEAAIECCPIRFDRIQVGASAFVTLYWIDNDPSIQGSVSYKVHTQGSTSLEDVNAFISRNRVMNSVECGCWLPRKNVWGQTTALPECWQHQSDFSNGQGVRECHVSRW